VNTQQSVGASEISDYNTIPLPNDQTSSLVKQGTPNSMQYKQISKGGVAFANFSTLVAERQEGSRDNHLEAQNQRRQIKTLHE